MSLGLQVSLNEVDSIEFTSFFIEKVKLQMSQNRKRIFI